MLFLLCFKKIRASILTGVCDVLVLGCIGEQPKSFSMTAGSV